MRWKLLALATLLALYPFMGVLAAGEPMSQRATSNVVTRAEAVYRLVESDAELRERFIAFRSHMPPLPLFHDVSQEDTLAPYLEVAFERGIISGNRERLFYPRQPLRTDEAHAMVQRRQEEGDSPEAGDVIFFVQPISRENFLALLQGESTIVASSVSPLGHELVARDPEGSSDPERVAEGSVPLVALSSSPPPPSDLFAITLPTLGIEGLTVTHPKDPTTHAGIVEPLKNGVGHLFGFPGGGGKVFIYGHSSGYPWDLSEYTRIFRKVNRLVVGDLVHIAYQGQRYTYQVTGKETVRADDLRLFQEEGEEEELILYTCWPPDSTSERLLVHAKPVEHILPLPVGEGQG